MDFTNEKFILTNIRRKRLISNEIRADRNTIATDGSIERCEVECINCQHKWEASDFGTGKIRPLAGGFMLTCPNCSNTDSINYQTMNSKK